MRVLERTGVARLDKAGVGRARAPRVADARRGLALTLACGLSMAWTSLALAQAPEEPADDAPAGEQAAAPAGRAETVGQGRGGRRVVEGPPTALAFRDVAVSELVPFIVEVTGKVVIPQQTVMSRKITVLNDRPIPREEALDLVVLALQQNGVAVVETDRIVTLRDIGEITRQDVPVVGPEESLLARSDTGTFVEKVFRLRFNTAKKMGDVVKASLPEFAKMSIDEESNQISVMGNVGALQRIERLVNSLDRPAAGALTTETFRLRFSDPESIKQNIEDLFAPGEQRGQGDQNRFQPWMRNQQQGEEAASTSAIKVTASTQQNAVTVAADPSVLNQIRRLVREEWDLPLPAEAIVPRIYDLKHTDPVKVATLLSGLFGSGASTTGAAAAAPRQGGQGQGQGQGQSEQAPAAGQGAGRLAGQFTFQPMPDAGRLIVVAKSPDNLAVIDEIIKGIDQPQTVGLPEVIELKHAQAEDLAEQLNALLAQEGTLAAVRRAEAGLSDDASSASPFASDAGGATTDDSAANPTASNISFWWAQARVPTDRRSASNLIAQLRIVPVWRQNALLVVAPPEYKQSIADLVAKLDRPGRQVLISAIVAEVSREDALQLGLRVSSREFTLTNPENSVSIGTSASAQEQDFASSLFDTSLLSLNTDVNVLLQALAQDSQVSILSEPRIFTSDNQEAEFFDGQDIPFVTDSQTNQQGNLVQSFDYRAVGIQLRARPRITVQGDVDLRVNLELSSIVPGQTLFGGFVVDRRETTTQLIVRNAQTVVISGILREENTNIVRKVPLLGDIPLLGELFKSRDQTKINTELMVFITPIVVNNTAENEPANEGFLDRLRNIRGRLRPDELSREELKQLKGERLPQPGDQVRFPSEEQPAPQEPAQEPQLP